MKQVADDLLTVLQPNSPKYVYSSLQFGSTTANAFLEIAKILRRATTTIPVTPPPTLPPTPPPSDVTPARVRGANTRSPSFLPQIPPMPPLPPPPPTPFSLRRPLHPPTPRSPGLYPFPATPAPRVISSQATPPPPTPRVLIPSPATPSPRVPPPPVAPSPPVPLAEENSHVQIWVCGQRHCSDGF